MRRFEEVKEEFLTHPEVKTILPQRSSRGSAGYDFKSKEKYTLKKGESHMFWTDVCVVMFMDNLLKIYPRSGMAIKHGVVIKNGVGIIDSDYYANENNYGNIGICLVNNGDEDLQINIGDRIAQGIFEKYYIVDDDVMAYGRNIDNKRNGGFGSSGR